MGHGIMKYDKGFVFGTTWHGLPQYIVIDRPVTIQEAETVLDYDIVKNPLYRYKADGELEQVSSFAIVRDDKDILLCDGQGKRFTVENNIAMLRRIDEMILARYPSLFIESVGTLFNGQTAFINLKADEFQVKGDQSPTETNLMYSNPIGTGSYLAYAHHTRVVCNNTLTISKLQGEINNTMRKFSHTQNASQKIVEHLVDLSGVFLGLDEHKEDLNRLAEISVDSLDIKNFLDSFFPLIDATGKEKKGRGKTIAQNNRNRTMEIFENQTNSMSHETAYSRYGLLQAYTDYIDHEGRTREDTDQASIILDGITGQRSKAKDKAFQYLLTVAS